MLNAQLPAKKSDACAPLSSESFVVLDVLSQQRLQTKFSACEINIHDSTYMQQPGVHASSVEEDIRISYDQDGRPLRAEYTFDANTITSTYKSLVIYAHNGYSTLTTYTPPSIVPITQLYLFQRSSDGLYTSEASWWGVSKADTNQQAFYRITKYRDVKGADSLILSEVAGTLTVGRIASINKQDNKTTYTYHWFSPSEVAPKDTTWTMYEFLSNHGVLSKTFDASTTKSVSNTDGLLTIYEHTWSGIADEQKFIHAQITRSASGHPSEMRYATETGVRVYRFLWK